MNRNEPIYCLSEALHLGNIIATVSDRKEFDTPNNRFNAKVVSAQEYFPFGSLQPGRNWNSDKYRYGFNGQEMDNEVSGIGNTNTAEFWEYDSRLGRRWNRDMVVKVHESPYACFANNPIWFADPNGADTITDPNGDRYNVGDGYAQSEDGKMLYGEKLTPKIWDPNASSGMPDKSGAYVDYDPRKHGKITNVNSAREAFGASFDHADAIILQGNLLEDLITESDLDNFRNYLLQKASDDPRCGNTSFAFDENGPLVYFGGRPSPFVDLKYQAMVFGYSKVLSMVLFPQTWLMASRPITWVVGRNYVEARVEVTAAGAMSITYRVEGNMNLDAGNDKSGAYKMIAGVLSQVWKAFGGSESLPTYGAWQENYILKNR